ncbi:hypothetical protein [Burkholderia sp. Nafp2/4-1b]|uniref:hypothetical protein n=1 Tax=Burkholderia sp. Nafp2/4-1b TaxID=2116686 RepID=UPI0013CE5381|nr:hypothetical protein [Burkholderia sp. Nafp2/4-1b]
MEKIDRATLAQSRLAGGCCKRRNSLTLNPISKTTPLTTTPPPPPPPTGGGGVPLRAPG